MCRYASKNASVAVYYHDAKSFLLSKIYMYRIPSSRLLTNKYVLVVLYYTRMNKDSLRLTSSLFAIFISVISQ